MAFDLEDDLDGDMTINQTESACELIQDGGVELADIHFDTKIDDGTVFRINKAGFNEKLSERLSNLMFVEVSGDSNFASVKEEKEGLGWTFICKNQIWAGISKKQVAVFGKKS